MTIVVLPTPGPLVITSAFAVGTPGGLPASGCRAQLQTAALFDPRHSLLFVYPCPGHPGAYDADQPLGDRLLRPVEARQENARGVANFVGDHGAAGSFEFSRAVRINSLAASSNSSARGINWIRRQPAMAPSSIASVSASTKSRRATGSSRPFRCRASHHGGRVGALETNASDIPREPIGVLGHDLHGVRAVGLEDANRPGGPDPVAV